MKIQLIIILPLLLIGCTRVYDIRVQRSVVARCGPSRANGCSVTITQCRMGGTPKDPNGTLEHDSEECRQTTWSVTEEESKEIIAGFWRHDYPKQY